MARHRMKFDRQLPFFSFLFLFHHDCFILRLVPLEMSSGDSGKAQPNVQDSIWASVVGLALGRTPSSSGVRSDVPRENPVTPALDGLLATGQRTDAQNSLSRRGKLNLETELGDDSEDNAVSGNRGDDPRIQELLVRL